MRILLYNPDNGVTRNFMPHLWMFLLKTLTPPEHQVLLIDGNAKPMNDRELVKFIKQEKIESQACNLTRQFPGRRWIWSNSIWRPGLFDRCWIGMARGGRQFT